MDMEKETNDFNTVHWDRLCKLEREWKDGRIVEKGSTNGGNILRICEGERGRFVRVNFSSTLLVNANIKQWPSSVSSDGKRISLWLMDFSFGWIVKRKFFLTFFDERGAELFFRLFTSSLPKHSTTGLSFAQMKVKGAGGSDYDEDHDDDGESDEDEDESFFRDGWAGADEEDDKDDDEGDNKYNKGGDEEEEEAQTSIDSTPLDAEAVKQSMIRDFEEMEANFGSSQLY